MKNNIKMVLKEIGRKCFHGSNQAQNRVDNLVVVKIIFNIILRFFCVFSSVARQMPG
jgi:hypothetical protein